jgi:RNA polymerase sigma-70 factor (ECF subfamily)
LTASEDETALIMRAASGDPDAFAALCEAHRDRLWRVVSSVAEEPDREDLAQEAIVRAFKSLKSYRGGAPFSAWLCRIAVNTGHDYRKSAWKRRVVRILDLSEGEMPALDSLHADCERREMQRRVRQSVSDLPELQRIAVWLVYFEGFTVAEVSRLEQTSESTIRSRLQAGLKRLARPLRPLVSDLDHAVERPNVKGCET